MTTILNNLKETLAALRRFDPEFTLLWAELLLTISKKPGMSQIELGEKCGASSAAASRALAEVLMLRHGLIRQEEDPDNRRKKRIFLTNKGERFVHDLEADLTRR